jgi:hypothetical protein
MALGYDLTRSYWLADDGRLFGSAPQALVPESDPDYQVWLANHAPITWPRDDAGVQTDAALQAVVGRFDVYVNLNYYAASVRYAHASGGVIVTSIAPGKTFQTDPLSRNGINSGYDYTQANPANVIEWKFADGSFTTLDNNELSTLMNDIASFVQACFGCEGAQVAGIADGSITTREQVDAAFAAITNVFP